MSFDDDSEWLISTSRTEQSFEGLQIVQRTRPPIHDTHHDTEEEKKPMIRKSRAKVFVPAWQHATYVEQCLKTSQMRAAKQLKAAPTRAVKSATLANDMLEKLRTTGVFRD